VNSNQLIKLVQSQENLKALIVDLDGTLVDTMNVHKKGYELLFDQHGWNFDSEIWETKGPMGGTKWLQEILVANNVINSEKVAAKLKRAKTIWFLKNINRVKIIEPVFELIQWARQNTILKTVCATTAFQEIIDRIFDMYHLYGYFDLVLTAKDVPNGKLKPDPYIYYEALNRLNVKAENCIAIEDSDIGCQSALSAGVACFNISSNKLRIATPLHDDQLST